MEEGSFVQQAALEQRGEILPQKQEEEEETLALEQAAPEDLKQVMSLWKSIVAETSGRFRVVLASAVPKYNRKGGRPEIVCGVCRFPGGTIYEQ